MSSLIRFAAGLVKGNVFQDGSQPDDLVKDVEHPERIEQHENDNDVRIGGLLDEQLFHDTAFGRLLGEVDRSEGIEEKNKENNDQDKFEEQNIKMAHHPARGIVVKLPDLGHKIHK